MREADPLERLRRARAPLGGRDAGIEQPVGDVLERGGVLGEEELLEHEPDAARAQPRQLAVVEPATSTPSIRTTPPVGRSSVPITCSSVDLPEPEGPTIATSSPRRTESHTPRRAATGGSSP